MKKALLFISISFFVSVLCPAQESGNRIYGNRGYAPNNRLPVLNTGQLMPSGDGLFLIEASVLLNRKPDSFVAVFGVAGEGPTAAESERRVTERIVKLLAALRGLGIGEGDTYVDFITQNKVYDFRVEGDVAEQFLDGFETKKTVAVRYADRALFGRILEAAAGVGIHDLIKVDYIVADFDSVRDRLFEEAARVVEKKLARYRTVFGMTLRTIGPAVEKYDAFYPAERYERYTAFESGAAKTTDYRNVRTTITLRKSSTFFYEPLEGSRFDRVVDPAGIEPTVQFTIYLQVRYRSV